MRANVITDAGFIDFPSSDPDRFTLYCRMTTNSLIEIAQEKIRISLHDIHFAHSESAGGPLPLPDLPFTWDRKIGNHEVAVYTDNSLKDAEAGSDSKKVAWLIESPVITAKAYRWIRSNYKVFDRVLTFDQEVLEELPNSRTGLLGGCWIKEANRKIHDKNRNVSIIASAKNNVLGQKMRHKAIRKFGHMIDAVFGGGYRAIDDKAEGLAPFRYSIVIENCRRNYYFSEKLIDCFMTGTIPIYWGCPSIGLFFDKTGMICFDRISELRQILQTAGEKDYDQRSRAIRSNFETAKHFIYPEYALWSAVKDLAT
jgi:hypothetical protein